MDADGDAVAYHELLGLARDEGLIALDVHVIQVPGEANGCTAVVQATARTHEGGFAAVGSEGAPANRREGNGAASTPALHPTATSTASPPGGDEAGEGNGADQETHPDDVTAPHPAVAPGRASAEPARARDDPDGEGI